MIKKKKNVFQKKPVTKPEPVKKAAPQVTAEWLYMTDRELSVREISEAFDNPKTCEFWEAAGVAEVVLTEKASMDLELIDLDRGDEEGNAFLEKNQAKVLYQVTIVPECYELSKAAMETILKAHGGLFCGDNEDFSPQVSL